MPDLFTFEAVTVQRGDTRALDDLTVPIPQHGVTAVIGASGSGKSTLLRCCNLLEQPTNGRIMFRGADLGVVDPRKHRRQVAMVFQAPTVFAGSALANLRAADRDLSETAASALLERVGLSSEMLHREADTFSGGEAQRLCLARALATHPEVILADEATSALDPASTAVLEDLARSLAQDGIPVVWVTHNPEQLRRLADHVIHLDAGRLQFAGPLAKFTAQDEEFGR